MSNSCSPGGGDLIVFSHLRWSFVWQRPQHLISRLAAGRSTWFVEEPVPCRCSTPQLRMSQKGHVKRVWFEVPGEPGAPCSFEDPSAAEYLPALQALFAMHLESVKNGAGPHTGRGPSGMRLVWLYTPMALLMAKALDPSVLIYDVMDDLGSFKNPPPGLRQLHVQALKTADVVFAGGHSLYESVSKQRAGKTYLFASGVDPGHYAVGSPRRPARKPVAGYVGVIDERIDLELIAEMAAGLPDWEIQMVGPVVKIDPANLPNAENIRYLGQQPYEALPAIMAGFNAGLMPFALNDATRSISPTKTLEYLAAGLPVISTKVPDVVSGYAGVVELKDDGAGFAEACRRSLLESGEDREARVRPLLKLHNWDAIAGRMQELIAGAAQRKKPETAPRPASPAFDYLIVGAGFAGSVLAERLAADADKRVLVVEKRNHIGGNAYDCYDDAGVMIHKYGPHIFHTNSPDVFSYLSRFTSWRQYEHRVLASVDGALVPIPINVDTVNRLYGLNLNCLNIGEFFASVAEPVEVCRTSEDVVVSKVGRDLYEKMFKNYTRKQWGLDPSELEAAVAARVPVRTNRDDRYFTDRYQAMPRHGYTRMFEAMLSHPNIKVMLKTDYREIEQVIPFEQLIYTGPIDEYFDFCFGKLPYRSLDFRFESHNVEIRQEAAVINYPNEHPYTRVTEFKYLTGQEHPKTSLVYEYPMSEGDPYYPIPRPENAELFKRYKALGDALDNAHFVGRLATYKYYNMDQVVAQALALYGRLKARRRPDAQTPPLFDLASWHGQPGFEPAEALVPLIEQAKRL